jgi:type II secretory pathway pseudopilin PulG
MQTGKPDSAAGQVRGGFRACPGHAAGFTYIGILIAIAILGVALAKIGVIWHTLQQREHEHELLFVGDQFRKAIGRYYNVGSGIGAAGQYPQTLDDLLRDPRLVGMARYLRKIYYDPMTGSQQWGLVKNTEGRIIGVYSKSHRHPIKQANFSPDDKDFSGKTEYAQWTFIYSPKFNRTSTVVRGKSNINNTGIPTQGQ